MNNEKVEILKISKKRIFHLLSISIYEELFYLFFCNYWEKKLKKILNKTHTDIYMNFMIKFILILNFKKLEEVNLSH